MRQSKTTLKELTAAYRAVLRYGILCNAIALGLASAPAMAYVFPVDGSEISGQLEEMQVVLGGRNVAFENVSASGIEEPTYSGAVIENLGTSTVSGSSVFTLNSAPAGGVVYNTGNMTISDAVFGGENLGNSASDGGAVYNTGIMTVGGAFTENTASNWGGAIYNAGDLTISDNTTFTGNKADSVGGAITNALGTSVLRIGENVMFTGNEAVNDGGAIGNYAGAVLVDGTTFSENKAQTGTSDVDAIGGGAISLGAVSSTQIANATFTGNTSGFNGGAIGTRNAESATNVDAYLDIIGSTFTGNKATGGVVSLFHKGKANELSLTGGNGGALDNHFYNSESKVGAVFVSDSTFSENEAVKGGAIYNNGTPDSAGNVAKMYVEKSTFTSNTATATENNSFGGGAIDNAGEMVVDGGTFTSNQAAKSGGAINTSGKLDVIGTDFESNKATERWGGAILSSGVTNVDNARFTNNIAGEVGGAISTTTDQDAMLTVKNSTFENNHSLYDGGAIGNYSGMSVSNSKFKNNTAHYSKDSEDNYTVLVNDSNPVGGGAISLGAVSATTIGSISNTIFEGNKSGTNGGAVGTRLGASANNAAAKLDISADFTENEANKSGGAIYNTFYANNGLGKGNGVTVSGNFVDNVAGINGGAIYNDGALDKAGNHGGIMTVYDSTFSGNTAGTSGGAIYNSQYANMTIAARDKDVMFSGNTANGFDNDIYNAGTLALKAADGRIISLAGGIDGSAGTVDLDGEGTVNVANTLKNQTVNVNAGELHLSDVDLTGSTVAVAGDAALNMMDNKINNYTGITLADGASLMADFGMAGATISHDAFTANGKLTLSKFGVTSDGDTKTVDVAGADKKVFVADNLKAYTTGGKYTVAGSEIGQLTITKVGDTGGLKAAASDTGTVTYNITGTEADETVDTNTTITNNDLLVKGTGTEDSDKSVKLAATLAVAEDASLTIEDAKVENKEGETSAIENQVGGQLTVLNSKISTNINNAGVMYSDPSIYGAQVVNTGTATFDGDVFEDGSSLTNSAVVNLNNMEFAAGSTLTGLTGNILNVSGTNNKFNGTSTGNNVKLASGANYTGTLSNGSMDSRNGTIDTVTGSVSGGDLYVDANLDGAGAIDSFGDSTGATIKTINLTDSTYGTAGSYTLNVGGADVATDVDVTGATNYFTKIVKNGNNLVFGDKLMNTSGTHALLGDWAAGTYIGKSNTYNVATDSYANDGTTVGAALTALDTQVKTNADNIALKANFADVYTKTATDDLLSAKQATLTAGNVTTNLIADKAVTNAKLSDDVNASLAKADSALQAHQTVTLASGTNNGTVKLTVGETVTDNIAITGLGSAAYTDSSAYATAAQGAKAETNETAIANITNGTTYTEAMAANVKGTIDTAAGTGLTASGGVLSVNTATAVADGNTSYVTSDLLYDQGYQNATQVDTKITTALANGGDAYQTASQVTSSINTALGAYSTTTDMNTALGAKAGTDLSNLSAAGTAVITNNVKNNAVTGTYSATGEYADNTIGKAIQTNVANIALKADAANVYTKTEADGLLNAKMNTADWTVNDGADLNGAKLANGSVASTALADNAVTTAKINNGAVTLAKIKADDMVQGTDDYATSTQLTSKGYVDQKVAAIESAGYQTSANVASAISDAKVNTALTGNTTAENLTVGGNTVLTTASNLDGAKLTSNTVAESALSSDLADKINGKADSATTLAGYGITDAINTSAIATTLTGESTDAQVASAKAVYDAISASTSGTGAVAVAVADATTMQHTTQEMASGVTYKNFDENASVTEAVAALDAHTGKVHGLISQSTASAPKKFNGTDANASKNKDASGNYVGNLAVGTTTEDHLVALDNAIGSLSSLDTTNGVLDNTASVAQNLQNLDTEIDRVARYTTARNQLSLNQAVAYTDARVDELDKEMSSGIASAVALSSVAVSNVNRGEVSVGAGYGYYNGRSAAAFGAAMGLSNRWSVNAGAGVSDADVSFRAGTNYKFKLF